MMFIGILFSIAAIGLLCCLLFTFAVFALPAFAGAAAGMWAYQTGAGWAGSILVGLTAAAVTLGIGQFLVVSSHSLWMRLSCYRLRRTGNARRLSRHPRPRETHCSVG